MPHNKQRNDSSRLYIGEVSSTGGAGGVDTVIVAHHQNSTDVNINMQPALGLPGALYSYAEGEDDDD